MDSSMIVEDVEDNEKESLKKRFYELYPMVDEKFTPLPKCWNIKDKCKHLLLSNRNLRVHYNGLGKSHRDAGSIRANHFIPPACGVYYFEIKIINKGAHGYIGVGFSSKEASVNRLPGWELTSYGYHGDDGYKFHSSGAGVPYGPPYTSDDIIGCGINFIDKTCFFTKNGHNLGVAFVDLPMTMYPMVGMQTRGEVIEANFGQEPFVFNISFIVDEIRARVKMNIINFPIFEPYKTYKIVLSYLLHHGYIDSALALAKFTGQTIDDDMESLRNRQSVTKLVRQGKIEEAINMTNSLYPKLLSNRPDLLLKLMCRQFVEVLKKHSYEFEEEIKINKNIQNNYLLLNDVLIEKQCSTFKTILNLGKEIYKLNKQLISSDLQDKCKEKMIEAFGLIAYNDPNNSDMKWLLDDLQREPICNELNSAILKYLNRPPISVLDLAPSMARDLLKCMIDSSNPTAVYVNLQDYLHFEQESSSSSSSAAFLQKDMENEY